MFGMPGSELPYRGRKDLARAQQMRGITRRRGGPASPPMDSMWLPMLKQDYWRRDCLGSSVVLANMPSRFEDISDRHQLPRPIFPSELGYGSSFAQDPKRRAQATPREPLPFDQAADALCQAVHFAVKHCKSIRDAFEKEIERSTISLWAPRAAVDALWSMKLEWNGIDLALLAQNANQQASPDVVTYKAIAARLFSALEDVNAAGQPRADCFEESSPSKLRPEVFRVTVKKLLVGMQGVEELMQAVRMDRTLMAPLVKDLKAVAVLLGDIEELWRPTVRTGVGSGRARWEDEECTWPEYQGE
ncbi:hypothetical protein LTR08_001242 [Meristemomyces frigidus]|nr:hypothetical protein LTR08_001242 [Meristemomyces frigidus]